jgi:isohexenylglutaconyl-CoA hydratase
MMLPDMQTLVLDPRDGVLHLTLNRPQARNAMNPLMVDELNAVFDAIHERRDIRVVVLRGAEGHFCAGADLKEVMSGGLKPPAEGEVDPVVAMSRRFGTLLRKVGQAPQVVVAVIEGSVLGGGFGLACVSDIALAKADAKFGLPETTRGLPPAQIAPFVVERVGLTTARRLCLSGARFDGVEARRLGLVHEIFADDGELDALLAATLKQVLDCAPLANAMTKAIILSVAHTDMDTVLDVAAQKFAQAVRGPEAGEGITAFMQKRAPKWAQG